MFERVAAAIGASFNMTGDGTPERIDGVRVSSSFFPLFGAHAALGRVFTADEDQPGKTLVGDPHARLLAATLRRRSRRSSARRSRSTATRSPSSA